jgi:hypothetical protein
MDADKVFQILDRKRKPFFQVDAMIRQTLSEK